jgi:hypothetical protein
MTLLDSLFSSGGDAQPAVAPQDAPQIPQDNGQTAYNYFVGQGLSPVQAAGIVGNLQGESGQGLNPNSVNRGDGREGSDSIGIGQWNGTRAQALKDYAASKGTPVNDLNTQLEFLHSELKGPESSAYKGLLAAQTPEDAGRAMLAYERPKDWNVSGAHPERAQYAARAYSMYGGSNPSMAQSAPASPARPANATVAQTGQPIPQPQQPIFPQQAQAALGAAPSAFAQMPAPQMAQAPQIFYAPRKPIDLTALHAALANRAPIFPQG